MSSILTDIKKLLKSKNLKELSDNTSPELISAILFFPIILIILTPVRQFIEDSIYPNSQRATYPLNISTVHLLAAIAMIICYGLYLFKRKFRIKKELKAVLKNPTTVFFSIFMLLMIISTLFNGLNHKVFYGDPYRNESLFTFLLYFLYYFAASALIKTKKRKALILYANIAVSTFIAVMVLIDELIIPVPAVHFPEEAIPQMVTAIFCNSNHYAYYLVISIMSSEMLFIKEKSKKIKAFCLISFILQVTVLIINDTLGCFLACGTALIFSAIVLFITEKKINRLSVFMIALFLIITLILNIWYSTVFNSFMALFSDVKTIAKNPKKADNAGTNRWRLWKHTVKYISEKPFLGFGVEGIGERLFNDAAYDRPHNEFLQYAAFFGIPAAISYICGVFSVFLKGLKNKYKIDAYSLTALTAAFGYLVSSFFGNTMYYTAPYFFIMLGIGFSIRSEEKL